MNKTKTKTAPRQAQKKAKELMEMPAAEESSTQAQSLEPQNSTAAGQPAEAATANAPVRMDSLLMETYEYEGLALLREMHKARVRHIMFYTESSGGNLDIEEAIKRTDTHYRELDQDIDLIMRAPVENVSWYWLGKIFNRSPADALDIWVRVKDKAYQEFISGHRAAEVFDSVHWMHDAWDRARYLAIRDSFIEQWQPQGGIDVAMIEMLVQSFSLYLYWTEQSVLRTQTEMRAEPPQWIQARAARDAQFPRDRKEMGGYWDPPSVTEQEAVEHAALMADRYAKAFQRNLRAMRDLRRYVAPVTINNPQQVNIAADGGQQVNVAKE